MQAISEAFDALKTHWSSESISNPRLKAEQVAGGTAANPPNLNSGVRQ